MTITRSSNIIKLWSGFSNIFIRNNIILLFSVNINTKGGVFLFMKKLCDFGKKIKIKLVEINQTQSWLIEKVKKDTGLYFDSGYLQKIFTGELKTPDIVQSIRKILNI